MQSSRGLGLAPGVLFVVSCSGVALCLWNPSWLRLVCGAGALVELRLGGCAGLLPCCMALTWLHAVRIVPWLCMRPVLPL